MFEKYTFEKAQNEAEKMSKKIKLGEAQNYTEAEKQINEEDEPVIITPETFSDKKYWERRNFIKNSDEQLIKLSLKEGSNFQDATEALMMQAIIVNEKDFKERFKNYPLFDIGCGKYGDWRALKLLGYCSVNRLEDVKIDLGIPKVVLIDPFLKEEWFTEESIKGFLEGESNKEESMEAKGRILFKKNDGLGFLLKQKNFSGNSMTSSINYSLISNTEYLKRIAQEIYRATPEDGIFVSTNCSDIEFEAGELFPYKKRVGAINAFSKKQFETDEMNEVYKQSF